MKLFFFILVFFISPVAFSQLDKKVVFEEKHADSTKEKFDSILIISVGNNLTRAFLEDLSQRVVERLGKKNIVAQSYYFGKSAEDLKKGMDSVNKAGYKAVLYFLPIGMSRYGIQNDVHYNTFTTDRGATPTVRTTSSRLHYTQRFDFQLCVTNNNMERIWSASVEVDCDPGKAGAAKIITKKMLSRFEHNNYIQ